MAAQGCLVRELVEPLNGSEVLRVAGWLEFRVQLPEIIALESGIGPHPATEQAAAERTVAESHNSVRAAVGENLAFDVALEQIVRRL